MKKLLHACLLGCLVCSPMLVGSAATEPDRVEVAKRQKKSKKQAKLATKSNDESYSISKSPSYSYHPLYYIKDIGAQGKTLTTYDETVWLVSDSDSYIARTWYADAPVVITPNYSWFSSYDFRLKNMTFNESVAVNLSQGPFVENAIFITDIDTYYGIITLSNGSAWSTGYLYSNNTQLRQWKVGQAVLIGESDNWFSPSFILVNINENNYVAVDVIQ
jgi:hypothetical protein